MKKLTFTLLAALAAGTAQAACPAVSSAELGAVIARHGGIEDPRVAPICSRVRREAFAFIVTGDFGVENGGAFAWANVLLEDPQLGLASSSHFAASTQHSKVATPQEAERLFLKAVSEAIGGMKYEDAIAKLRQSKAKVGGRQVPQPPKRSGSAGGA